MKKRCLLLVVMVFCVSFILCSCSPTKSSATVPIETFLNGTDLIPIPGEDNLAYYKEGKTVYIVILFKDGSMYEQSHSGIAPLIIHGHYCEYIDGEIVEVIE